MEDVHKYVQKNMIKVTRILILILIVLTGSCNDEAEVDYGILLAVPNDAGVIVKASDLCALCNALSDNSQIWAQLSRLPRLGNAAKAINVLDTISQKNSSIRSLLQGKSAMVSFHKDGTNKTSALFGVQLVVQDYNTLMSFIDKYIHSIGLALHKRTYDKTNIYKIYEPKVNGDSIFFTAYTNGYFLASTSRLTVEQAVRHIHKCSTDMQKDKSLKRLLTSAGTNVTAVMIFNHKKLSEMFAGDFSTKANQTIAEHANWSVLDISIQKQVATCAGYTDCSRPSQTLGIIKSQQPVPNRCHEYLPSKTTSFVSLGISDMHLFENDFKNHLHSAGKYSNYEANNEQIRKAFGVNFGEILYTNIKERITEFSCTYSLAGRNNDHYIIAELHDADNFEKEMASLCKKYRQRDKIADKDGLLRTTTSKGNKYHIYKFPIKHTFNSYFGKIFATESEYLMIYKELAVFGTSVNSLSEYANAIDNGKTLDNNSTYNAFSEYVNEKSNLYYYIDIAYSQNDICKNLSQNNASDIASNFAKLHNIRSLALQYSHNKESDVFYTNAALMYSAYTEAERYISWIAKTDTTIRGKPQVVNYHDTGKKDIVVQDETFRFYLFDKDGKREFCKLVSEPITSPIYQIDIYGNGKIQYVFATEHFLHALDRNGNYLNNFPVTLPAKVATEISVFDYDGTHDYRIFVPCTDRCLYVYTKEGVRLDSWTPLRTNEPLVTPVQFFRIEDNDYLIFADNLKTYIVNRRGEIRINVTNSFTKSRNSLFYLETGNGIETRFVTTNSAGEIKYIYTDGSCKSKTFKNFSADHHFVLKDIDGDGSNEYIFTDQESLLVFHADGSEAFYYGFEDRVGRPGIFQFAPNDVRIGVTCRAQGQMFLFDNKGKLCSGFPLQGTTDYSISKLGKNSKFSLLAGNADNYLYNYTLNQ